MSSHVKISSPFIKSYEHNSFTVTGTFVEYVTKADAYKRRVVVIIQNQGATTVTYNSDGSNTGIQIAPGFTLSFDNYNGSIWLKGANGNEVVHVAIAEA